MLAERRARPSICQCERGPQAPTVRPMLSRVADSIFWMSRYIERAENVARFIDVNLNLTLDLGEEHRAEQWEPLVDHHRRPRSCSPSGTASPTSATCIEFLTFDARIPTRFSPACASARENARTVREIISSAMWEELNKFYLMVRVGRGQDRRWSTRPTSSSSRSSSPATCSSASPTATMSHGEAWHFARMGRLLERADKTSRILDVKYFMLLPTAADVGTPLDTMQWSALLEVGQRPGNVSQAVRADHAAQRGRLSDPRSRVSPGDALLPAQGRGIAARDHRQPARARSARRPNSGWGGCARSSITRRSATSSTRACTNSSTRFNRS